jgi:hypothetical protein
VLMALGFHSNVTCEGTSVGVRSCTDSYLSFHEFDSDLLALTFAFFRLKGIYGVSLEVARTLDIFHQRW